MKIETDVTQIVIDDFFLILNIGGPFHGKNFSEKKHGVTGLIFEKREFLKVELNKRIEAATSGYSTVGNFLQCIYSSLVAKNRQKF